MADNQRQFTLVGNFTDNITQALGTINTKLDATLKKLEDYKTKYENIVKLSHDLGEAAKTSAAGFREQALAVTAASDALRGYATNSGRANRSIKGGGLRLLNTISKNKDRSGISDAKAKGSLLQSAAKADATASIAAAKVGEISSKTAQNLARAEQITARAENLARRSYGAGGGRGPGGPPGGPPRRGGGGGGFFGGGPGRGNAGDVFGFTLGSQLGGIITGAIYKGFQIGVDLMVKPFQALGGAIGERVKDEISDLQAAAGIYTTSKESKNPFVTSFQQSLVLQEKINSDLARAAGTLPGVTSEYVQVSKRLTDGISRVVVTDIPKAVAEANRIVASDPRIYGTQQIQGSGDLAAQEALRVLTTQLTTKTVLAGYGGRAGAGGASGPYGLPGLSERILSQDQVSIGQFQRYSAIFSNPLVLTSLKKNIDKINATQANSIERYKTLNEVLSQIVPPELLKAFYRTADGVTEGLKSVISDPEVGLFGLGRKIKGLGYAYNDLGQAVDKNGKVLKDGTKQFDDTLNLYKVFRDIYVNFGQVLVEIIAILPDIFDPLSVIGKQLSQFRDFSFEFVNVFNRFLEGYEIFAKSQNWTKAQKLMFKGSLRGRAAIDTIAAFFQKFGIIGQDVRDDITKVLKNPDVKNLGGVLQKVLGIFFSSDAAAELGKTVGGLIGTVVSQVAQALGFFTGIATTGKLATGLKEGWISAGGPQAVQSIFSNLGQLLVRAITEIFQTAPITFTSIGAAALLVPSLTGALSIGLGNWITGAVESIPALIGSGSKGLKNFYQRAAGKNTYKLPIGPQPGPALGTTVAEQAGTTGGLAQFATVLRTVLGIVVRFTAPLLALAAVIVLLGGGVENTMRQFQSIFGEIFNSLGGAFQGFMDIFGGLFGIIGDVGAALLRVFTGANSAADGLQLLKFLMVPITAAFQALELGLKGLALLLREIQVWFNRKFGSKEAYQKSIKERDAANISRAESQGRANAYNASILGKDHTQKELDNAKKEFNRKGLSAERSAELRAFIKEATLQINPAAKNKPAPAPAATPSAFQVNPEGGKPQPGLTSSEAKAGNLAVITSSQDIKQMVTPIKTTQVDTKMSYTTLGLIKGAMVAISNKLSAINSAIGNDLNNIQSGVSRISSTLLSGQLKVKTSFGDGAFGVSGGGGPGYGSAGIAIAGKLGDFMKATGGAPGSIWEHPMHGGVRGRHANGSLHYAGRAIDIGAYAHEQGPVLNRVAQFNAMYGLKPTQLFHAGNDPKGHGDHVHVAYANGYGMPFTSALEAMRYEKLSTPGSVKVGSITGNSSEGFGGTTNVTNNITITQQQGQSMDQLASIVALKISNAVQEARSSSYYV